MKLQISFDLTDLNQSLLIAEKVEKFADILEIGSSLIYIEGVNAIKAFREKFPQKEIFADIKLVDRVEHVITTYSKAGANCISILAGTTNSTIQKATKIARENNCKIALDLVDAYSKGQSSMDAKALDVNNIIFHGPHESTKLENLLEEWQGVIGNTKLPIFISGHINKDNIKKIISLKPQGIIIGAAITQSKIPEKEAEYFKSLL